MRELKTRNQILAVGLTPFERGERFVAWPLHVTLVSWFTEVNETKLLRNIRELAVRTRPIVVELGERAWFGANREIPVHTLEPNKALHQLHLAVLTDVYQAGGKIEEPSYISYKYRPHITDYHNEDLDERYVLDNIALIDDINGRDRQVAETFRLQG